MKKRTRFLLTGATMLLVLGGIGSFATYEILKKDQRPAVQKEYQPAKQNKDKTLEIALNTLNSTINAEQIHIEPSSDDKIHLSQENSLLRRQVVNWKVTEENGKTKVQVKKAADKQNFDTIFFFNTTLVENYPIRIQVPASYQKVSVTSKKGNTSIIDLDVKELVAKSSNGDFDLENVITDKVSVESKSGSIFANDRCLAKTAVFKTDSDIHLYNIVMESIEATTKHGMISTSELLGNCKFTTIDGMIDIKNTTGELDLMTTHGDIYLDNQQIKSSLKATSKTGSIMLTAAKLPKNYSIKATSKTGDVNLLGKTRTTLAAGTSPEKLKFELLTDTGNITVRNYEDDYYEDYEDIDEFEDEVEDVEKKIEDIVEERVENIGETNL